MNKIFAVVLVAAFAYCTGFAKCQDMEFDRGASTSVDRHPRRMLNPRHPKARAVEMEFDIGENRNVTVSGDTKGGHSKEDHDKKLSEQSKGRNRLRHGDGEGKSKKAKRRKATKERQEQQERRWYHCSDGRDPKNVKELVDTEQPGMGHMCRDLYPDSTCCYDHDLTMELVGDKMLEQIPDLQCVKVLMKLRCAHCSPRSWWLFHAPDKIRYPHKRAMPIMCPSFCRNFHRLCRDYIGGLQDDHFCDYHTTKEEGPCFPDSFVRRGTID